jgi:phosphoglycerate dehydrogenase-like enzyme
MMTKLLFVLTSDQREPGNTSIASRAAAHKVSLLPRPGRPVRRLRWRSAKGDNEGPADRAAGGHGEGGEMPTALISINVTEAQLAGLRAAVPGVEIIGRPGGIALRPPGAPDLMEPTCPTFHPDLDLPALLAPIDAIVAYALTPDLRALAPRLRWVQVFHAGVDGVWQPFLDAPDITVTTLSGIHPIPMAEFVLSMMLYFAKRLDTFRAQQARHEWTKHVVSEMHGATVAIVGYGTIGQGVARACQALGMRVIGVRRTPGGAPPPELVALHGPGELATAVAGADYVVSILPSTPETAAFWNATTLGYLRRGATFINVGRGRTVDEAALLVALEAGHLGAAGLDVTATEPLPADSPLWEAPNTLIVPHSGSETVRYTDRGLEIVADNLRRFAAGQPLRNVADKHLRY